MMSHLNGVYVCGWDNGRLLYAYPHNIINYSPCNFYMGPPAIIPEYNIYQNPAIFWGSSLEAARP